MRHLVLAYICIYTTIIAFVSRYMRCERWDTTIGHTNIYIFCKLYLKRRKEKKINPKRLRWEWKKNSKTKEKKERETIKQTKKIRRFFSLFIFFIHASFLFYFWEICVFFFVVFARLEDQLFLHWVRLVFFFCFYYKKKNIIRGCLNIEFAFRN